jgi:ABC-type transport system involved in multi-copper enzyme maturation permease subunit
MSRANLLAYARWHARDALLKALVPAGFFLVTAGIQLALLARAYGLAELRASAEATEHAISIYRGSLPISILLGGLLVGSGYVALDRERGHVRFLFSAPIVAWQYYLLRFTVGVTLFVLATALVPLVFGRVFVPVPLGPVLLAAVLYAMLLGSLAMLAGALARRDGVVVIAVTIAAFGFQGIAAAGEAPRWIALVASALPPINTVQGLASSLLRGVPAHTGDLSLVLGYALAMLVTALYTIHRAPLVR